MKTSTRLMLAGCFMALTGCAGWWDSPGGSASSSAGSAPAGVQSVPARPPVVHAKYHYEVAFVPPLTATEMGQFKEISSLSCSADKSLSTPGHSQPPESVCLTRLREDAIARGADVIVINSKETISCSRPAIVQESDPCVKMKATGYRRLD